MDEQRDLTLKDYSAPITRRRRASPVIQAESFLIPYELISMIMQSQFGGFFSEDPNAHIDTFLEFCGTIRINGATDEAIRLKLFTFSLKDRAKRWFRALPDETLSSWELLEREFLNVYFPPSRTIQIRKLIQNFFQVEGESFSDAWDRYRKLLYACPHHGLPEWLVIHTFYNGLNCASKQTLDAAAGGALMNKELEEARGIIEKVAYTQHQWINPVFNRRGCAEKKLEEDELIKPRERLDYLDKQLEEAKIVQTKESREIQSEEFRACEQTLNNRGNNQRTIQEKYSCEENKEMQIQVPISTLKSSISSFCKELMEKHMVTKETFCLAMDQFLDNLIIKEQNSKQKDFVQPVKIIDHVESTLIEDRDDTLNKECIAIKLRNGRELEDPKPKVSHEKEKVEEEPVRVDPPEKEKSPEQTLNSEKMSKYVPPPPYKPPIPFPQRLAKARLEEKFGKFLEIIKQLHINIPLTEALQEMPNYAKFFKEILSNKRKLEDYDTIALTEECSALIQNKLLRRQPDNNPIKEQVNAIFARYEKECENNSEIGVAIEVEEHDLAVNFERKFGLKSMPDCVPPSSKPVSEENDKAKVFTEKYRAEQLNRSPPKLGDPGNFIIPCTIGILKIEKALCDSGASINMMPLTIYEKLGIGELKPVNYSVQFASGSVLSPKGIIEDIPVKVRGSIVLADFVVVEMEQDSRVQIFLGRPFLATAGALIDVRNSEITFNIGDNNISFMFDQIKPCLNDFKSSEQVTIPEELSEMKEHGTGQHGKKDKKKENVTAKALFLHKEEESHPLKKKKVEKRSHRGPYYWSNKFKEKKKKVVFKESYLDTSIDEVMMDRRYDIAQGRIQAEDCDPG